MNSITQHHHVLALPTEQHKRWLIFRPQVSDPDMVAITFKCAPCFNGTVHLLNSPHNGKPIVMSEGTSVWNLAFARLIWEGLCKEGWRVDA